MLGLDQKSIFVCAFSNYGQLNNFYTLIPNVAVDEQEIKSALGINLPS